MTDSENRVPSQENPKTTKDLKWAEERQRGLDDCGLRLKLILRIIERMG